MLRRLTAPVALVLAALATVVAPATARTIDVTITADSGTGSLRQALTTAGSGDVVAVPAGTYLLTSGALTVPAGVTVAGASARTAIVSGGSASGVFRTGGAGVTIQDLTVTGGRAGNGAGIYTTFGVTLHRVAVVDNIATGSGGGIYSNASLPLVIDHSLIARNQGSAGGGIDFSGTNIGSSIVASTIAGNTSAGAAGGLYVSTSRMLLDGSTLAGNIAAAGGSQGGNFRVSNSNITLRNTVLAAGAASIGANCYLSAGSTLTSLGHNAQDTDPVPDSDCQNGLRDPTDRARLVLQLSLLQDNGGPTDTLLPAATSPLVNTGDSANCSATDQRGVPRPQGTCDVGAVERTTPLLAAAFAEVTTTTATLYAATSTIGLGGSARFAYGPTNAYGAFSATAALPAGAGTEGAVIQLTGLLPSTTYHFQGLVTSPDGTVAGPDQTFTTAANPGPLPESRRPVCRVPRLAGKTLRAARAALTRASCQLGQVRRPRARRGGRAVRRGLVVRRQARRAGSIHPAGTAVGVTLGPRPPRRAAPRRRR